VARFDGKSAQAPPVTVKRGVGLWGAVSIGIGGMVGGGIFAVLGLAVQLAGGGTPIAFALGGVVALVTAYSYARLSVTYPSRGGTVEFLNQAFSPGLFAGGMNVLLWLSYLVMLALYARAFGSYAASLLPSAHTAVAVHVAITGVIVLFAALNLLGSKAVGRAEIYVVATKLAILVLFLVMGLRTVDAQRLAQATWPSSLSLVAGGMIIFVAYEGFELIANTAENVRSYETTLPLAYLISVGTVVVLYVLIAIATVGNLPIPQIIAARDYALAAAARPVMGSAGFTLIAVAAMLSTASAINATLYGAARVNYVIAKDGELPKELDRQAWSQPVEGLLLTTVLALALANLVDLTVISTIGSAGFLLVFAAVNVANARLASQTRSRWPISALGAALCLGACVALVAQTLSSHPTRFFALLGIAAGSFALEGAYRKLTGRRLKYHLPPRA
jgi:amino acid transporter